jgi:hypothetical protein
VPTGNTAGSAATVPLETGFPLAVIVPMQYAVATNALGADCGGGLPPVVAGFIRPAHP